MVLCCFGKTLNVNEYNDRKLMFYPNEIPDDTNPIDVNKEKAESSSQRNPRNHTLGPNLPSINFQILLISILLYIVKNVFRL